MSPLSIMSSAPHTDSQIKMRQMVEMGRLCQNRFSPLGIESHLSILSRVLQKFSSLKSVTLAMLWIYCPILLENGTWMDGKSNFLLNEHPLHAWHVFKRPVSKSDFCGLFRDLHWICAETFAPTNSVSVSVCFGYPCQFLTINFTVIFWISGGVKRRWMVFPWLETRCVDVSKVFNCSLVCKFGVLHDFLIERGYFVI